MDLAGLIQTQLHARKLDQKQLAEAIGVDDSTISNIITKGSWPRRRHFDAILDRLGIDLDALLRERNLLSCQVGEAYAPYTATAPIPVRPVPVIGWHDMGSDNQELARGNALHAQELVAATGDLGLHAFAVRMPTDSMEPKIPQGAMIVIDPDRAPLDGQIVAVRLPGSSGNAVVIREWTVEAGTAYLKPTNARYPLMAMPPDAVVIGVARQVMLNLP